GTFGPEATFAAGPSPESVVVGDFSGDGKLDLATANRVSPGSVSVLLGNGDGTFGPPTASATAEAPAALVVGDFNGDGNLDVAAAPAAGPTRPVAAAAGDGDGDGHRRLAVRNDVLRNPPRRLGRPPGQRRRHLRPAGHACHRDKPPCAGGGGLQRRRQARPRR